MGTRVPVDHYDLSSAAAAAAANSYIGTSLHDLNSGDEVTDPAADDVADDNDDRSSAVVSVSFTRFFFFSRGAVYCCA